MAFLVGFRMQIEMNLVSEHEHSNSETKIRANNDFVIPYNVFDTFWCPWEGSNGILLTNSGFLDHKIIGSCDETLVLGAARCPVQNLTTG